MYLKSDPTSTLRVLSKIVAFKPFFKLNSQEIFYIIIDVYMCEHKIFHKTALTIGAVQSQIYFLNDD